MLVPDPNDVVRQPSLDALREIGSRVDVGDVVTGPVLHEVEGGLLLDIGAGLKVFLPADQVDSRPPCDLRDWIGRTLQCLVVKIDESGLIVVSRRALHEPPFA